MALNNLGLGFVFTARDLASSSLNRLGRNFQAFERQSSRSLSRTQVGLRQLGVGLAVMTAGIGTFAGALKLSGAAGEFEQQLARVAAISDVAADGIESVRLRAAALDAGLRTQFSPKEAAQGLQNFAAQGFSVREQTEALNPALRLAQAGMIGITDASQAMTSALKVFGLETNQAGITTDKLLKITTKTSLQAEDLTLALGTVGRGAGLAKQNLDEMLISMGLVKNTGVDTSVAASSVSSALIFMSKNADKFNSQLGVSLTDSQGNFRNFVDVVLESSEALNTKYADAAERTAVATKLFGRFGVSAFQAVSSQIQKGVKNASGEVLKGRDAIAFLRQEMEGAAGTAEEFEKKILDTFEGQKKILEGAVQTLAVTLGQPFARAFKPIVTTVKNVVTDVIAFVQSIPDPVKTVLAQVIVGAAALATAIGGILAIKGAITVVASAIGFLGITLGTVLSPLLAVAGALAVIGLAIATLNRDAKLNGGGIIATFKEMFGKAKLFFEGLVQVLRSGALSGAVLEELNKSENKGIKSFLGRVLAIGFRIKRFFDGVSAGFSQFMIQARPVLQGFREAMKQLGESLGIVSEGMDFASGGPSQRFLEVGFQIGRMIGQVAILIVRGLTLALNIINGVTAAIQFLRDNTDRFIAIAKLAAIIIGGVVGAFVALRAGVLLASLAVRAYAAVKGALLFLMSANNRALLLFDLRLALVRAKLVITRAALIAYNAVKRVMLFLTSSNTRALLLFDARLALVRAKTLAAAAANRIFSASSLKVAGGILGKAGLVAAAGAAGFAFGTWLDKTFKLSDGLADLLGDITGLNKELDELDKKAGGRTNVRGFGGKDPFQNSERTAALAAQRGLSVEEFKRVRAEELRAKGFNPDGSRIEGAPPSSGVPAVFGSGTTQGVVQGISAREGVSQEALLAEMTRLREDQLKNLEKLAGDGQKQFVVVQIDGKTIATAVEKVQRSDRANAFQQVAVED